jgi:hypothetical protein
MVQTTTPQTEAPVSLKEIWDLDARIKAVEEEKHEAERLAGKPYADALELLQAKRDALFDRAFAADAPPEVHEFGTLRIQVPTKKSNRVIDVAVFKARYPELVERCLKESIPVTVVQEFLTDDEVREVCEPQTIVKLAPKLVLINPAAPKVMAGHAPRRKKSEIMQEGRRS